MINTIPPISAQKSPQDIQYRRQLNRLNLQVREKVEELNFFYPFDTKEKQAELNAIEAWKNSQKAMIYEKCYNPQPSALNRLIKFLGQKLRNIIQSYRR